MNNSGGSNGVSFISDEKESAAVNGKEMRPYYQQKSKSCGGSFSGGSAVSDSNLPRSVGPHNTLSIKDEMETA
ncbi:hypothetical protein HGM15179_001966 [Zosterops borbonicus]|uniref:Uncharacterized protein n=1 Tax=Zosterops borbonicus TaxID=364589 RepID=A0A8K1LTK2_9PASS|nr:hypothetical protein HGM15179_001966 [Zosterops borbonicus]